jgi:hypothetical protein
MTDKLRLAEEITRDYFERHGLTDKPHTPTPDDDFRSWIFVRNVGCVPERKGPFEGKRIAEFVRELMAVRPYSFIEVVSLYDGPNVEDGPTYLMQMDGRSTPTATKHLKRLDSMNVVLRNRRSPSLPTLTEIETAVRAVNSNAELVAALEDMRPSILDAEAIKFIRASIDAGKPIMASDAITALRYFDRLTKRIDAALTQEQRP